MEHLNKTNPNIITIFVKLKLGMKLNEDDIRIYEELDYDIKETIYSLINSEFFVNDIDQIVRSIISSKEYSDEENKNLINKWNNEKMKIKILNNNL